MKHRMRADQSPEELQRERHVPRVSLDIGDFAERASRLMHQVHLASWAGWQTIRGIGKRRILMIERIEHFPLELEVSAFRKVEVLHQG